MFIYKTALFLILFLGLLSGITIPNNRLFALDSNIKVFKQQFFFVVSSTVLISLRLFIDINSLPDLEGYSLGYEQICKTPLIEVPLGTIYDVKMPEIGFRLLMKFISYLSDSFNFFLLIFGWVWYYLYYRQIRRYSPYIILSVVLLALEAYSQSLFVLRQHMAMAIAFCAFPYIIQQNFKKYFIIITIAFLFHQTAIVFFPVYFIYSIKNNKKLIFSLIILAIAAYSLFSILLSYFGLVLLSGLESYVLIDDEGTNVTGALISLCHLSAYVYFLRRHIFDEGINRLLFIILFFSTTLGFAGIGYAPTSRLLMYYSSTGFLLIPVTTSYIKNKVIRNIYLSVVIALTLYFCFYGSGSVSLHNISFSF